MHTFLLFFGWPNGAVYGNVGAMPLCGGVAFVAAFVFRDKLGRALRGWWHTHFGHGEELSHIKATLDRHADLLNPATPGGLAQVLYEVKAGRDDTRAMVAALMALLRAHNIMPPDSAADPAGPEAPEKPAAKRRSRM